MREAEAFPYMITIEGSRAVSGDSGMTRGKDGGFRNIVIDKDSDSVKAIRFGKFCDKVHGDGGEQGGIRERGNQVKWNRGAIREIFGCLTNSATVNIIKGEMMDTRPIELVFDKIPSLYMTRMTDGGSDMKRVND